MAVEEAREEEFLKIQEAFRTNAFLIIDKMMELNNPPSHLGKVFLDEILHSILFLAEINNLFTPQSLFMDDQILDELKESFPRPFELYSFQLPRRSPFSCVLDMIVHLRGANNENEIRESLQNLSAQLADERWKRKAVKPLASSTICVSQNTRIQNPVSYYGVSMSTWGRDPGQIMIAASCLSSWDSYVADAVMTYYPNRHKRQGFDGTFRLPQYVRCEAFSLSRGTLMPPCRSCVDLFGLETADEKFWPYGNCAEAESVSNLLKNEAEVRKEARPTSGTYTEMNREETKESVLTVLRGLLQMKSFQWDDENPFYTPQRV